MKEEKISIYRALPMIGIFLSIMATTGVLCRINKMEIDQVLCVIFVIVGFMPVLIFELVLERKLGNIGNNIKSNYKRILMGTLICCVLLIVMSFLPEFYRPVMLLPLIMSAFSNAHISSSISLIFNVLLTMTTGGSFYELLAYTILIVIAISFSKALGQAEYRPLISMVFMFSCVLFPSVFYYLSNNEIIIANFLYCFVHGGFVTIYTIVFYPKEKQITEEEIPRTYEYILEEDYIQIREVRAYSMAEYHHARKVSEIAFKYANALGLNAQLAAAGGFYYRIIDALLIKVELLEKEVGESQWNRDILIYQTLNELSTAGLYDKSGLSINGFIKIREWLAKEELLV